jgi:uncharacterized protein (TIGR02145 family)/uncharacterized repeat protein (TIGR02543 family)
MSFIARLGRTLLMLTAAVMVSVGLSGCGDDNGGNSGGGNNAAYTLQISINPISGGSVSRNPEKSTYTAGEQVTVTAQPASGYDFAVWSGVSTSTNSSVTVTMNANLVLTANFQQQSVTPPGNGDHVHDWGDWVVTTVATCDAAGVETRTCKIDNSHKETRTIPQLTGETCQTTTPPGGGDHVHTWDAWTVTTPATCTSPGVETRTCTQDASHKETRPIAQLTGTGCELNVVDPNTVVKGTITDSRNGKTYSTVKIGSQTWMAENLNYQTTSGSSWCYNCNTYGRLYDWAAAKMACPVDWHLSSNEEWDILVTVVGGQSIAGKKLKAKNGWNRSGNGTDDYGFSAMPGGGYDRTFVGAGIGGSWWTATTSSYGDIISRSMNCCDSDKDEVAEYHDYDGLGMSVRCVKDE